MRQPVLGYGSSDSQAGADGSGPAGTESDGAPLGPGEETPDAGEADGSTVPTRSTNCAPSPHACGYPDETNTGVSTGTVFQKVPDELLSGPGWTWDERGFLRVESAGTVLEALDVAGEIYIIVPDVTVRNCRVTSSGESSIGISVRPDAHRAVIERNTISGVDGGNNRLMAGIKVWGVNSFRASRNDIRWASTGIQTDVGTIEDNFIHDFGFREGESGSGVTSNGYGGGLIIRHNTIFNQLSQTDAISLFQDFGIQKDALIDDNLVAGGRYTLEGGGDGPFGLSSNIKITNNRLARTFFPGGGFYDWLAHYEADGPGNELTGNVWDDTDEPLD